MARMNVAYSAIPLLGFAADLPCVPSRPAVTLAHRLTLLREQKLVDDDVVRVNLVLRQFLDQSFRLV